MRIKNLVNKVNKSVFWINQLLSVGIIIISFHLYKILVSCCRFGPFFWSSPDSGSSFWCKSGISICFVYASKQAPKVLVVFVQPIDLPNIAKEKKGHSWVDKKFFLPSNSDPPVNSYQRLPPSTVCTYSSISLVHTASWPSFDTSFTLLHFYIFCSRLHQSASNLFVSSILYGSGSNRNILQTRHRILPELKTKSWNPNVLFF